MEFFKKIGLVVCEIYGVCPAKICVQFLQSLLSGMTENPNNNANVFNPAEGSAARVRLGSVGQSAPGCQTRLHLQVVKKESR